MNQKRFDFIWIFALALVPRIIFCFQWAGMPYGRVPFLDALSYDTWAKEILRGEFLRATAFYQSPLYPYFLALIYKIAGHGLLMVSLAQAVLSALSCAMIAALAGRYFSRTAGATCGVLAALYRPLIFYSAPLMKETLMVLLLTLFTWYAVQWFERGRGRDYFLSGLFLALTALVRANVLLLAIPVLALELTGARRLRWRQLSLASVGLLLPLSLTAAHNWTTGGDFVLVNYTGGFNFYIAHSPSADGLNAYPPDVSSDPVQEERDVVRIAESARGRPLHPGEVSAYWFERGLAYASANPGHELSLLVYKLWIFINNFEIPDNYDVGFIRAEFGSLLALPLAAFGLIFALAGANAVWERRRPAVLLELLFAAYLLSVILFYVTDRYRLPAAIFLLPLAGAAIARFIEATTMKSRLITVAPALPFLLLTFWPMATDAPAIESFNWGSLAALDSDAGRDAESATAIRKAIAANGSADAYALVKASTSEERLGHVQEARDLLRLACEKHPTDGFAYFNFGRFHYEHGQFVEAEALYKRALEAMPWMHQPYIGLAILYYKLGHSDQALKATEEGLKRRPGDPQLLELAKLFAGHQ